MIHFAAKRALALVGVSMTGCSLISGLDGLEKVQCAEACDGGSGAIGEDGTTDSGTGGGSARGDSSAADADADASVDSSAPQTGPGGSGDSGPYDGGTPVGPSDTGVRDTGRPDTGANRDAGVVCASSVARIFATRDSYSANLGGLVGADQKCTAAAAAAGLGGNWTAWLSDSTTLATSRIYQAPLGYKLVNGTAVATSYAALISGNPLQHAIDVTEYGATITQGIGNVWTGTCLPQQCQGVTYCSSALGDWTSVSSMPTNVINGFVSQTSSQWTFHGMAGCNTPLRLYCFEKCQ